MREKMKISNGVNRREFLKSAGFVVYSIGEDGTDDGGKERPRTPPGPPARQMLLS